MIAQALEVLPALARASARCSFNLKPGTRNKRLEGSLGLAHWQEPSAARPLCSLRSLGRERRWHEFRIRLAGRGARLLLPQPGWPLLSRRLMHMPTRGRRWARGDMTRPPGPASG